jgi:UDP-hydrolysing UDP-N-acetyl-D-glucosamine 2-epimerase
VLDAIGRAPDLSLSLLVSGMHLSTEFGHTVDEIVRDGWPIAARIAMLEADDRPAGIALSVGRGVAGFGAAYERFAPDLVVVLGDRFEMLAAASAALPFALPVAHIHGGEVSEGAMDNQIRHALTKLSHVHLASAEAHARRIVSMGEEPWRVHVTGAPGLDRLRTTSYLTREALARDLDLPARDPWLLVTMHPVTLEYGDTEAHVDAVLGALDKVDGACVLTYPNADTAGRTIIARLEEFAARTTRARLVPSLGEQRYLSLLREAAVMVGNSSSGLIEAPSFALPAVNVGTRQQGRLRGANVIDVPPARDAIVQAIEAALAPGFRDTLRTAGNPYGDGHAAPRIVDVLRTVPLGSRLVVKRTVDPA